MSHIRSPGYPSLSLSDAVEMIRKVHAVQQTTAEPKSVVLKHMGYSGVNGRSLKSISALIKYGFLEKEGREGLKVTDRAIAILFPDPENPSIKDQEMIAASREPSLFSEIFARWSHRPPDESLRVFLINKGFNINSVDNVARAFYETFDLVSGLSDSYDSQDESTQDEDEDTNMAPLDTEDKHEAARKVFELPEEQNIDLNVTNPVFDFETVRIHTMIDNQEDLTELISRLEKIKAMLPLKTQH